MLRRLLLFGQALLKAIDTALPVPHQPSQQCLTTEGESVTQASIFLKIYGLLFQLFFLATLFPLFPPK